MDVKQGREENKQKGVLSCKSPYGQLKLNLLVGDPGNSEESVAWSCLGIYLSSTEDGLGVVYMSMCGQRALGGHGI